MAPVVGSMVKVPCAGGLTTFTLAASSWSLPSGSVSLARTSTVTGLLPSVSTKSSLAVGRWMTTVTVAVFETSPSESVTVYFSESVPMKKPTEV